MDRDDVIDRLRATKPDLKARGVTQAALFGSLARGDARPDSDMDIMVEIDPVDVVEREGLRSFIQSSAMVGAVYVF
jgi:predicted nucleotidyltransferase